MNDLDSIRASYYESSKETEPEETEQAIIEEGDSKIMDNLREDMAELEHKQWLEWSQAIADTEKISIVRLQRWSECWKDYKLLTEELKDYDRAFADKILALPSLREAIEKAERWDKLFEGLKVEEGRYNCVNVHFSICYGTGKKFRELTEKEKEEFFRIATKTRLEEYHTATYLNSGVKVVRDDTKKCRQ